MSSMFPSPVLRTLATPETWFSRLPNQWGDNRYLVHQDLWTAFPNHTGVSGKKEQQPFLYRVETDSVLVRSRVAPVWGPDTRVQVTQEPVWGAGDVARLDVHLNVHRRLRTDSGKVRDLPVHHEDAEPFVLGRLASAGLSVVGDDLVVYPFFVRSREQVPVYPVRVVALVRVIDPDEVARALAYGLGRVKFLGFGMPVLTRP